MKTPGVARLLLALLLQHIPPADGFLVVSSRHEATLNSVDKKTTDDIAHELEELGNNEILPHLVHEHAGFEGFTGSHDRELQKLHTMIHNLKEQYDVELGKLEGKISELQERKLHDLLRQKYEEETHNQEVKELKEQLNVLEGRIFDLQEAFQSNELEWEAQERKLHDEEKQLKRQVYEEETQLLSDIFEHEKHVNDSYGKLFTKLIQLTGRRMKKGAGFVWRLVTLQNIWHSREKAEDKFD